MANRSLKQEFNDGAGPHPLVWESQSISGRASLLTLQQIKDDTEPPRCPSTSSQSWRSERFVFESIKLYEPGFILPKAES